MLSFVVRLRERKLLQWSIGYLGAAFVLLQGLQFLADQFTWPGGLVRGATIFFAVNLLAVLVLAWYHGEQSEQRVGRLEDGLLALILLLAGGGAAVAGGEASGLPPPERSGDQSIAVLPLANLSSDRENGYLHGLVVVRMGKYRGESLARPLRAALELLVQVVPAAAR